MARLENTSDLALPRPAGAGSRRAGRGHLAHCQDDDRLSACSITPPAPRRTGRNFWQRMSTISSRSPPEKRRRRPASLSLSDAEIGRGVSLYDLQSLRLFNSGCRPRQSHIRSICPNSTPMPRVRSRKVSPIVDAKEGTAPDEPAYFAEAFVPVRRWPAGRRCCGLCRSDCRRAKLLPEFLLAAVALCGLTALSFGCRPSPGTGARGRNSRPTAASRSSPITTRLTGLANRARLIERLEAALGSAAVDRRHVALHFIDIDHFKQVNDTLGHDGGDFLLAPSANG